MVVFISNYNLRCELSDFAERDVFPLEVVVVLERHVPGAELVVGRTGVFLETGEFLSCLHLHLEHSAEVPSCENSVVRHPVVSSVGLEVMVVLETGSVGVSEQEGHERVTIIDSIEFLTL